MEDPPAMRPRPGRSVAAMRVRRPRAGGGRCVTEAGLCVRVPGPGCLPAVPAAAADGCTATDGSCGTDA